MSDPERPRPAVPEQLEWISWLRIVAICGVVGIHTTGYNAIAEDARSTLRGTLAIWLDLGAVFAVPVFVMISGALLLDPTRYPGPGPFLRRRALRLVPALIFWHVWYFLVIIWVKDTELSVGDALIRSVNGNLYTALYFFWIILGLAVVAPVLVPYVASVSRRGVWMAGVGFTLVTALSMASMQWRGAGLVFVDWALTWWIPYLGMFLLGYAMRGVVLRGWSLGAVLVVTVGLAWLIPWQWRNPAAPALLNELSPASYYGLSTVVYSCLIFLLFQSLIRPGGSLRLLVRPALSRVARTLGDATLGVFGLHLTVLLLVWELPVIGGEPEAPRALYLLLRVFAVVVITFAIVVPLRRVPVVRKVL